MASNGFIDLDSTYRNRQDWPKPGQFEINIAQSGTKGKGNALDPVSLAEPLVVWSCNALTTSQPSTYQVYGTILLPQQYGNVGYSQNGTELTLLFSNIYNNSVQEEDNYFVGLIFWNIPENQYSRIISYQYIGNNGSSPPSYSLGLVTLSTQINFNYGDEFLITDSSDLTRPTYPLIFVPNGKSQDNAYLNYILYCENNNDYRNINKYNAIYKYALTSEWDNISNYQTFGNFCIRKIPPTFPLQLENSRFVETTSTSNIINIQTGSTCSLKLFDIPNNTAIQERIEIPYKYDFLRLRLYRLTTTNPTIVAVGQSVSNGANYGNNIAYSSNQGNTWTGIQIAGDGSAGNPYFFIYTVENNGPNASPLRWVVGGQLGELGNLVGGVMYYSNNAQSWTQCSPAGALFTRSVNDIIYAQPTQFLPQKIWWASGTDDLRTPSAQPLAYSTDGITWTRYNLNTGSSSIRGLCMFGDSLFMCSGGIGYGTGLSPNYINVQVGTISSGIFPYASDNAFSIAISTFGSRWVSVGNYNSVAANQNRHIFYSTNSLGFTCQVSANDPFEGGYANCISNNGIYWLIGGSFGSTPRIAKSYNGVNWTSVDIDFGGGCNSLVWNGTNWLATLSNISAFNITEYIWIITSNDGVTWDIIDKTIPSPIISGADISVYNENQNYDTYTGIYIANNKSQSRQITSYINNGTNATFEVYPPFDITSFASQQYTIEVEPFSYDNAVPFSYNGTLVQQNICYEFELLQLILPNFTLSSGFGSKIAFYPYIYVELSNVSSSGAHLVNMMHSNNPNAVKMLFKVPIYDVQDPETTPFVRLVAVGMIHTMKFKPDDNLYFTVLLPNGDVFDTILPEFFSPSVPNSEVQVSALFRYKAVI
jgi:hypothetical protein